jgi:hypothetical protein
VEWLPNRDVGDFGSLDNSMQDESVFVWWGVQGRAAPAHTLETAQPFKAIISDFLGGNDDGDETQDDEDRWQACVTIAIISCPYPPHTLSPYLHTPSLSTLFDSDDGSDLVASESPYIAEITYEDGDIDLINLKTMEFKMMVCSDPRYVC